MVQANKLNGLNPLSYLGVNPESPVPLFIRQRSPTINDYQNFSIGTVWIVTGQTVVTEEIWQLVSLSEGIATWVQLYPGGGGSGASTFNADSGAANEAGGAISILGGTNCSTTGAGDTITINLDADIPDEFQADSGVAAPSAGVLRVIGGDNIITSAAGNTITIETTSNVSITGSLDVATTTDLVGALTANSAATFNNTVTVSGFGRGVLQSSSVGLLSSSAGTNGQVLIGSTGLSPAWANITSTDGSISITNSSNSINISVTGGGSGSYAFSAYQILDQAFSFVGATPPFNFLPYYMGSLSTLGILYNDGGHLNPGDGAGAAAFFTAPVSGLYYLQFYVAFSEGTVGSYNGQKFIISTPARVFQTTTPRPAIGAGTWDSGQYEVSALAPLDAFDEVYFLITSEDNNNPAVNHVIKGANAGPLVTWISGYRVA